MADVVLVCAKTDPKAGAKGISIFAVPSSAAGFHRGKKLKKLGLRAQAGTHLRAPHPHLSIHTSQ